MRKMTRSGQPYSGGKATNKILDAIEEKDFYMSQAELCFKAMKKSGAARRTALAEIEELRTCFKYGRAYEKNNEKELDKWGARIQDKYIPKTLDEETSDVYQAAKRVLVEMIASQRLNERQTKQITHDESGPGETYPRSSKVQ